MHSARKEGQEAELQCVGRRERPAGSFPGTIFRFDLAVRRIGRRCRVKRTRGGGLAELGSIPDHGKASLFGSAFLLYMGLEPIPWEQLADAISQSGETQFQAIEQRTCEEQVSESGGQPGPGSLVGATLVVRSFSHVSPSCDTSMLLLCGMKVGPSRSALVAQSGLTLA
jgi:hypothetical protein